MKTENILVILGVTIVVGIVLYLIYQSGQTKKNDVPAPKQPGQLSAPTTLTGLPSKDELVETQSISK